MQGILERIVYFNEENNYTVAKLEVNGRRDPVTIVGNLLSTNPGETLKLTGKWVTNQKFGQQFQVETCIPVLPASLTGIERYLGSGLIKGIGPIMAGRLVQNFELQTLDIIEKEPERLTEVEGIGPVRVERIKNAWKEQRQVHDVMLFLQDHGVSPAYAVKIYKAYGQNAVTLLRENPYRLATDISGIGFKTADRIAQNLGIDPNSRVRAEAGILYVLGEASEEGHVYLPEDELLRKVSSELEIKQEQLRECIPGLEEADRVVIADEQGQRRIYLKPLWVAEDNVAERLHSLCQIPRHPLGVDAEGAVKWLEKTSDLTLAENQKEAIRKALESKVLVITGGPGTGKTTLVNSLIRIMETKNQRIVLASPTGRAAKRLSEVTGKEAKTIHRLLEFSPRAGGFVRDEEYPLEADLVIVDEASMVDIFLMNHLLKAIPAHATLILVGDANQLPSVGPGDVLRGIINSDYVEVVTLTHIFRQAEQSLIVVNAHKVNRGEFPVITRKKGVDFYLLDREDPDSTVRTVKDLCNDIIPRVFGFHPVDEIQVLSPLHKGPAGVARLNRELQSVLNPEGQEIMRGGNLFRVNDKVMQIKNNYEKDVFNGDIGRITSIDLEEQSVSVALENREVRYDFSEMDELVPAYAISVHKSQGNEYPCVVIPLLPQHFVMLQRNLLYTAITRARKLLILVGQRKALAMAINNSRVQERYTSLAAKLAKR